MTYGAIPDIPVGMVFPNRRALFDANVHRDVQRGITGRRNERGAESIVLSHGYEDDVDCGDLIFYTGDGGRDPETRRQVADQSMTGRNLTLAMNVDTEQPVRVVRAADNGYRYDGLYGVEAAWLSAGQSGFLVCRFRLRLLSGDPGFVSQPSRSRTVERRETTMYRLVRDTDVANLVKRLHDYRCQICGVRVETAAGPYAEGAHVIPLGRGYDGPDSVDNVLCLCPNDHVRLDHGGLFILDELTIVDHEGKVVGHLRTSPQHHLRVDYLRAHRRIFQRP